MRSEVLILCCIASLSILTGCNRDRISEIESELSGLQEQLEESESRVSVLESSLEDGVSSLHSTVADLQVIAADIALAQAMFYTDHSSGILQTQIAADSLDEAVSDLESSISDLSDAL